MGFRAGPSWPDPALGERIKLAMELAGDLVTPASPPRSFPAASSRPKGKTYCLYWSCSTSIIDLFSDCYAAHRIYIYFQDLPVTPGLLASLELSLRYKSGDKEDCFNNAHKQLALEAMIILFHKGVCRCLK